MGNFCRSRQEITRHGKNIYVSRKSSTHSDALISEEHFGQISSKSGKSTYPINSFEYGNSRKNKSRVFGLETFSEFSHIIKVLVNKLIPPANQAQRSISHGVLLTKKYKSRRRAKAFRKAIG